MWFNFRKKIITLVKEYAAQSKSKDEKEWYDKYQCHQN